MFYESTFQATTLHPLKLSTILDSGTTIHVFNDLSRFQNFRKAPRYHYIIAGGSEVPILGYGDVHLQVVRPDGKKGTLRLKDVAFCTDFATNLVSFQLLRDKGYYWDNKKPNNNLIRKDDTVMCEMKVIHNQQVIEYIPMDQTKQAYVTTRRRRRSRITSRDPRPDSKAKAWLWHLRMGHPGPMSLHHLKKRAIGAKIVGPKTTQCEDCARAKIKRQNSNGGRLSTHFRAWNERESMAGTASFWRRAARAGPGGCDGFHVPGLQRSNRAGAGD